MREIIRTDEQLRRAIEQLCQSDILSIDFEMTGLNPRNAVMLIMSISNEQYTCAIDMREVKNVIPSLKELLTTRTVIAHNATLEHKFCYHHGVNIERMYCTMIAEQVLTAGMSFQVSAGLASVAERYLGVQMTKDTRKEFIDNPDMVLEDYHFEYAMTDVEHLFAIRRMQLEKAKQYELEKVFDLEMAIIPVTAIMEYTGIACNREYLAGFIPELEKLIKKADQAVQDLFIANGACDEILFNKDGYWGVNLAAKNPRKNKETGERAHGQLQAALWEVGVDVPSLGKKELLKWDIKNSKGVELEDYAITDDDDVNEAITQYEGLRNVYLRAISFHTAASKVLSSAVLGTLEKIDPTTGRVHFWFKQCGAKATGRFSSDGQQLPRDDKLKRLSINRGMRESLIAAPGRTLLIADYSGIELWELADFSKDERLIHDCTAGDIHLSVVKACGGKFTPYALEIDDKNKKSGVYKLLRDAFKTVSYSVAYGTTEHNLSETLSINLSALGIKVDVEGGKYILDVWKNQLYPDAGKFLNDTSRQAITKGYTTSALGRRRWYDLEFAAQNKWRLFAIQREASNHPMQATCVDMVKLALLDIYRRMDYNRARVVLTVHDEIIIESTVKYADTAAAIMKSAMEKAAVQLMPIMGKFVDVEVNYSDRYNK